MQLQYSPIQLKTVKQLFTIVIVLPVQLIDMENYPGIWHIGTYIQCARIMCYTSTIMRVGGERE